MVGYELSNTLTENGHVVEEYVIYQRTIIQTHSRKKNHEWKAIYVILKTTENLIYSKDATITNLGIPKNDGRTERASEFLKRASGRSLQRESNFALLPESRSKEKRQ